jgi:hypothetical protein
MAESGQGFTYQPTAETFEDEIYYRTVSARTAAEYMRELGQLCGIDKRNRRVSQESADLPKPGKKEYAAELYRKPKFNSDGSRT